MSSRPGEAIGMQLRDAPEKQHEWLTGLQIVESSKQIVKNSKKAERKFVNK